MLFAYLACIFSAVLPQILHTGVSLHTKFLTILRLSNAKKCADRNNDCSVFDESGKTVYALKSTNITSSLKVQIPISDLSIP